MKSYNLQVGDTVLYPEVYGNKEVYIVRDIYICKKKIVCLIENDFRWIANVDIHKLVK